MSWLRVARDARQFGIEYQRLGLGVDLLAFGLDQFVDALFQRRHLGLGIGRRRTHDGDQRIAGRATGKQQRERGDGCRASRHGACVFQGMISNRPAAPMPPPMHMVTTPYFGSAPAAFQSKYGRSCARRDMP